jgi:hypothetical protein
MIFRPHALTPEETMTIVVRAGDSRASPRIIRDVLERLDSAAVVTSIDPLRRAILRALDRQRALAVLAWFVAGLALLLSASGLHARACLWLAAARRDHAVRLALGASTPGLLWRAAARVFVPVLAGIAGGLALLTFAIRAAPLPITPAAVDIAVGCAVLAAMSLAAGLPALLSLAMLGPRWLFSDHA